MRNIPLYVSVGSLPRRPNSPKFSYVLGGVLPPALGYDSSK